MVLKVDDYDLESNVDRKQNGFFWKKRGCFVGISSANHLLLDDFQLNNHGFGFMVDERNEIKKGVSVVGDSCFKLFNWFNWRVCSVRYWNVVGERNKDGCWVFIQRD